MFKAQIAQRRHLVAEMEYLMVLMVFEILKFFFSRYIALSLIWVIFSMKQNAFWNVCYGNQVRCSVAVMKKLTLERFIGVNGFSMTEVLPKL